LEENVTPFRGAGGQKKSTPHHVTFIKQTETLTNTNMVKIKRILIANRGEIAVRIMKT
jgi:hypothetical protein